MTRPAIHILRPKGEVPNGHALGPMAVYCGTRKAIRVTDAGACAVSYAQNRGKVCPLCTTSLREAVSSPDDLLNQTTKD